MSRLANQFTIIHKILKKVKTLKQKSKNTNKAKQKKKITPIIPRGNSQRSYR